MLAPAAALSILAGVVMVAPAVGQEPSQSAPPGTSQVAARVDAADPLLKIKSFRTAGDERTVHARVTWNEDVTAAVDDRVRLLARVIAKPERSTDRPVVLYRTTRKVADDGLLRLRVRLNQRKADRLRAVGKVLLSISLQVPTATGSPQTYATTARLGLSSGKDCTPGPDKNLSGCRMVFWNLKNANMQRSILTKANLNGVAASGVQFQGADLNQVSMKTWAGLPDARFDGANLALANLTGANLSYAHLPDTNLYSTNLSHAQMRGANLQGAKLDHTDLFGANLQGANFRGATMKYVELKGANLRHAVWTDGHECFGKRLGFCD